MRKSLKDRFLSKVDKTDSCWLWTGSTRGKGYGAIHDSGQMHSAHRVSWLLFKEEPIGDLFVLHRCDTPKCVNPDHLFLGTNKDNMRDMIAKGRQRYDAPRGENAGPSKLTDDKIRKILSLRGQCSQQRISDLVGVNQSTVSRILARKIWSHVKE